MKAVAPQVFSTANAPTPYALFSEGVGLQLSKVNGGEALEASERTFIGHVHVAVRDAAGHPLEGVDSESRVLHPTTHPQYTTKVRTRRTSSSLLRLVQS